MKKRDLYIIRAVSGAGKTSFAESLVDSLDSKYSSVVCCADDFMINDIGEYEFDVKKLSLVHNKCREKFLEAIENEVNLIIIANTNTELSHFKFYYDKGIENGYRVTVLVLENYHGNKDIHNVPPETLQRQRICITKSLKLA